MENKITLIGKIVFEPENRTKKHQSQASWKKVAMINLNGDVCEYYSWFIMKRFNLTLNKPLRGAHITFINDSVRELTQNGKVPLKEANLRWDNLKKKWDGKEIKIVLDVSPKTNGGHWWLKVDESERDELHAIRAEVGLGRPFFGLHMTIGHPNSKNDEHSNYIHRLFEKGFI